MVAFVISILACDGAGRRQVIDQNQRGCGSFQRVLDHGPGMDLVWSSGPVSLMSSAISDVVLSTKRGETALCAQTPSWYGHG